MDNLPLVVRPPGMILKELERLQKELHAAAFKDPRFKKFIFDIERYPFRALGFPDSAQDISETSKEWDRNNK